MPLADDARNAGRAAATSARTLLAERLAQLLRKDPELQATALETGLVNQQWLDEPGQVPVSNAAPLEVVERFLERSAERNPSFLARAGLGTIQLLSFRAEEPGEGSTAELAIVFTDLEGFTRFTATRGDDAAMDLLAAHHRAVSPIVRGRGGKVVKRIGDGLMLSFPDPAGAIHAAVELLDATPAGLRLRAGVHHGEVVITRDDVIGHVVNVAARVAEAAKGGQAFVTAEAAEAAGDLRGITLSRGRRRSFKGVGEPIRVHRAQRTVPDP
ncbi:MAG: adenylate/guanylate cyclase domain-containing protein [Acidimicrobiia bacterium]|nr:adenylate/guanylate cyclase domain-containing protein [Acidimicrobiia bacterium]